MSQKFATACQLFDGYICRTTGYGRIGTRYAHREAYEAEHGPIPPGMEIDHLCRVRACVNPEHLEAVTGIVNRQRAAAANLAATCGRGHERWGYRPDGTRHCLDCAVLRARRNRERAA